MILIPDVLRGSWGFWKITGRTLDWIGRACLWSALKAQCSGLWAENLRYWGKDKLAGSIEDVILVVTTDVALDFQQQLHFADRDRSQTVTITRFCDLIRRWGSDFWSEIGETVSVTVLLGLSRERDVMCRQRPKVWLVISPPACITIITIQLRNVGLGQGSIPFFEIIGSNYY